MTVNMHHLLRQFISYHQHGVLPEAGGLNDQPATWVDAIAVLSDEWAAIDEEEAKRGRGR